MSLLRQNAATCYDSVVENITYQQSIIRFHQLLLIVVRTVVYRFVCNGKFWLLHMCVQGTGLQCKELSNIEEYISQLVIGGV